jgi:hypothetical protein
LELSRDGLLKEYETRRADAVATFYHDIYHISGRSITAPLRGHVFERQVLNCLHGMDVEHKFSIPGASEKMTWSYRGPIRRFNFLQDLDFIDEIIKVVQDKNPLLLVPSAFDLPTVYSILYDPNEVLTCIQITTSRKHHILVSGLPKGLFKAGSNVVRGLWVSSLRKKGCGASYLLYRQTRRLSNCNGWKVILSRAKAQQYVLGLDVFGRDTSGFDYM